MLTPMIPTLDPYQAASQFASVGWTLEFATPPESDDRMAVVSLGDNTVMLGIAEPPFVEPDALPHLGAGTAFHCTLPEAHLRTAHESHGPLHPTELAPQPWGPLGFQVTICHFRFMFVAEAPES